MTVKELIEKLSKLNPDLPVLVKAPDSYVYDISKKLTRVNESEGIINTVEGMPNFDPSTAVVVITAYS